MGEWRGEGQQRQWKWWGHSSQLLSRVRGRHGQLWTLFVLYVPDVVLSCHQRKRGLQDQASLLTLFLHHCVQGK